MVIVILGSAPGRRMRSSGVPMLIAIGPNETVLARQVTLFKQSLPSSRLRVVGGFQAERVDRAVNGHQVDLYVNSDYERTSFCRCLELALEGIKRKPLLFSMGTLVFSESVLRNFLEEAQGESAVLLDNRDCLSELVAGANIRDGQVRHFSFGLPNRWTGLCQISQQDLPDFLALFQERDWSRFLLHELLNHYIEKKSLLGVMTKGTKGSIDLIDVECTRDIARARILARKNPCVN